MELVQVSAVRSTAFAAPATVGSNLRVCVTHLSSPARRRRSPCVNMGLGAKPSRRRVLSAGAVSLAAAAAALGAKTVPDAVAAPMLAPPDTAAGTDELREYRGPLSLGFSFSYPADGWAVKKKPIKTHMSEIVVTNTEGRASSSAGVTVDAVKISKIDEFGTAEEVGEKVIGMEKKKDSVLSASLASTGSFVSDGLTYYLIEYDVESSRGLKHYLAKATITGGNLYVFTAQAKSKDFDGSDGPILLDMVDSFRVKPQYT